MPFTEDLSVFFADWGVTATPQSGAAFTVIFDRAYIAQLVGRVESTQPMCIAQTSDVQALAEGTQLTIGGTAYKIKDQEPDGTGISVVALYQA